MIARASSGSRSSINSIEPLISANSAVTVFRSPSSAPASAVSGKRIAEAPPGSGARGDAAAASARSLSVAPQLPQNLAVRALSNPHAAHDVLNAAPHSLQNLSPSGFSILHFAQIIRWMPD
jgi:hypothetical protein